MSPRGPVLREVALAVVVGVVFTASPFTPNELAPAAVAGFCVGGALLGWRLRRDSPVWSEPDASLRPSRETGLAVCCVVACLASFAPTLTWMYGEWTRSLWFNDHGIFIPFAMAWLAQRALRRMPEPAAASAWGFVPLAAGLGLSVLDVNAQSRYLACAGFLLSLLGLALLLFGTRGAWALRAPLGLALLLIPVPYSLAGPLGLRTLTARGVMPILELLGFTALREGTLIYLPPSHRFIVADACSGANTLWAALAMAIILGLATGSWPRRIALLVAAPALALAANTLRVAALVLLTQRFGTQLLDTPIHEATGVAVFVGVVLPLLAIARERRVGAAAP